MSNQKSFFWRVATIHAGVVCSSAICLLALNYFAWTYSPDMQVKTLESLLLPVVKPTFSLLSFALLFLLAFDPLTLRVIRRQAHRRQVQE